MKHSVAIFMIGLGLAGFSAAQARAETDWTDVAGMFNDPEFKKEFIAYYGFDAELEPRVTPEEVKVLESVREMMANDLPKAEATLRKQKPEGSAILSYTLGGVLFQEDKMDEAAEWYTKATDKFPSFRRAWRNMGLIQARGGKFDASIKSFTKMIELGGGDAYSYGLLGYCYSQKQDFQAAEAAYRSALLLQPENTEWRLGLTRCVFRQEKFEDAATLLDGLIERYPSNADFWALQAEAFLNMKQPIKAAENLEALDQMKKATPAHLFTLGDIYTTEDLFDLASNAYVRGVDADPKQAVARPLRSAEVLAARGALKEAKILSDEIHKVLEPQMVDADKHKLLKLDARLSLAEGGSSDETAAVLEEIVKVDPLDGEALMLLGQHYSRKNEPDKAIFYYERAESIESYEFQAKIRHAQVLVGMQRYQDAMPLLQRAQEIKPRDDVARYIEQVQRLARAGKKTL